MAVKHFDWEMINRFFKGECTVQEKEYLNQIFCDYSNDKELEKILRRQWYNILQDKIEEKNNIDHILYRIHYEMNTNSESGNFRKFIRWSTRIAAILFLPLLIYFAMSFYKSPFHLDSSLIEINAPAWTRIKFSLPDGTSGWLNSNSSLSYRGDFEQDRKLMLKGEAFFNVHKDSKHPFIVRTEDVNVKVLGTRFNMASYENEKDVEVVLEEGKLIFSDNKINRPYSMMPNERIIFNKTKNEFYKDIVQPQKYLSWTEGKLVFRNDPLDVIIRRLERWYNVDIEIQGNISQDFRLRATFFDENLEEVLYYLKRSISIDYKIEVGNVTGEIFSKKKVILFQI